MMYYEKCFVWKSFSTFVQKKDEKFYLSKASFSFSKNTINRRTIVKIIVKTVVQLLTYL